MTKGTNNQTNTNALKMELQSFIGDFVRYQHPLNRSVIYSPGVRHLAENASAYWLIDAIASWIGSTTFVAATSQDERIGQMHFWTLDVEPSGAAVLYAKADSPCDAFIEQPIEWSDFPLPTIDIWAGFDGSHWTLYLPSER